MAKYETDQVFEIPYPFVREAVTLDDGEGNYSETMSWRPGVDLKLSGGPDGGDTDALADGIGSQILTVVSVHTPPTWPTRVFYTRRWRDPMGHEFGKRKLFFRSQSSFSMLLAGYRHRYHRRGENFVVGKRGK